MSHSDHHFMESILPGIGRKFSLVTKGGNHIVIVVHNDERRELFQMNPESPDEMLSMASLDDEEARAISAILAGITYKPKQIETQEMVLDQLVIEWICVEPQWKSIGQRIADLDIRQTAGAIIIAAIEKDHSKQINPGPEYVIASGSTLVVTGERMHLKELRKLLTNGSL
ncbi:cation:proton antiporter regulatory subunit [Paenibacillus hodogayensis]|uniref:Cation:proton antiporter regulatory subunit n=1 Tax=Paenibacillus hodogayensis TaxID=279208 RepID=A0ABV5W196_9BACL